MAGRATVKDVAALTFFGKTVVTAFFPDPLDADSLTVRETFVKIWNEILVRLEQGCGKLGPGDLEVIGFSLRRTYLLAEAYKKERQRFALAEWMEKFAQIAKDAGISALGL